MNPLLAPTKTNGEIDWDKAHEMFPCLVGLKDVPQDPLWHAEGDVDIHTRMVCKALTDLPDYQALPDSEKAIVLTATLFHDVGKATCTKEEEDENGKPRLRSKGHTSRSESILRRIFWEKGHEYLDHTTREQILSLVRHHGKPVFWMKREFPETACVALSWQCNLKHLSILAKADALGRIDLENPNQDAVEAAELLAHQAEILGCLDKPFPFPNDHARFVFFQKGAKTPYYTAHNDRTNLVTMMCGTPAGGKDFWIDKNRRGLAQVCLDDIRATLDVDPTDNQGQTSQAAKEAARVHLRKKEPFIWNATNVTLTTRQAFTGLCTEYGAGVEIIWLNPDRKTTLKNNRDKKDPVPIRVIDRLFDKLDAPNLTQCHQLLVK